MSELPPFPKYPDGLTDLGRALGDTPVAVYERARAEAYKGRLEFLRNAIIGTDGHEASAHSGCEVCEALALTGDLP